jgi:hypothetical protein
MGCSLTTLDITDKRLPGQVNLLIFITLRESDHFSIILTVLEHKPKYLLNIYYMSSNVLSSLYPLFKLSMFQMSKPRFKEVNLTGQKANKWIN